MKNLNLLKFLCLVGTGTSALVSFAVSTDISYTSPSNAIPTSDLTATKSDKWNDSMGNFISHALDSHGNMFVLASVGTGADLNLVVYKNGVKYFDAKEYNTATTGDLILISTNTTGRTNDNAVNLSVVNNKVTIIAEMVPDGSTVIPTKLAVIELTGSAAKLISEVPLPTSFPNEVYFSWNNSGYYLTYFDKSDNFHIFKCTDGSTWTTAEITAAASGSDAKPSGRFEYPNGSSPKQALWVSDGVIMFSSTNGTNSSTYSLTIKDSNSYFFKKITNGTSDKFMAISNFSQYANGTNTDAGIVLLKDTSSPATEIGQLYKVSTNGEATPLANGMVDASKFPTSLFNGSTLRVDSLGDIFLFSAINFKTYELKYNQGYGENNLYEIQKGLPTAFTAYGSVILSNKLNVLSFFYSSGTPSVNSVYDVKLPSSASSSQMNIWIILGSVLGSIAGAGIIGALIYYFYFSNESPFKKNGLKKDKTSSK